MEYQFKNDLIDELLTDLDLTKFQSQEWYNFQSKFKTCVAICFGEQNKYLKEFNSLDYTQKAYFSEIKVETEEIWKKNVKIIKGILNAIKTELQIENSDNPKTLNDWLIDFFAQFRELLDLKRYIHYREFFPAFSSKITHLLGELWKITENKIDKHYELRLFSNKYKDQINFDFNFDWKVEEEPNGEKYFINNDEYDYSFYDEEYDETGKKIINIKRNNPLQIIEIPLNCTEQNIKTFIRNYIDQFILEKLIREQNESLIQRALNRLSLLNREDLDDIKLFLNKKWSDYNDNVRNTYLNKIFYNLGFETIPIEIILNQEKYKHFKSKSHPDIIVYDPNSNIILIIEEETELNKSVIYKKETVPYIMKEFDSFFNKNNRKISFVFIAEKISSGVENFELNCIKITKSDLSGILGTIFIDEILINKLNTWQFKSKIKSLYKQFGIDYI